jgi:hypothetical protein
MTMEFTKREYQQFYHGISMFLLSKKSAQKWRYDDETAEEISFLEGLESKVLDKIRQADTPQDERSEFVKVSDRECPWCKAVCASTDKYCHECGWHIADIPQTERYCTNCKHNGVLSDYECDTCHAMNHHEFIGQNDTPQTEDAYAYDEDDWYDKMERSE